MLSTILALVLTTGTALAAYMININQQLTGGVDVTLREVLATEEVGDPFYMLLIGIDRDEGRMTDSQYGKSDDAYRSDSIMLLRIDPPSKKVTMISIHRDTMYDFGSYGVEKINAAYTIGAESSMGGAAFTTKTISDFAGVPISHYAQVDMDAMAAVIDSIGGIDITLDMDCIDPNYTGLNLKKGPQHMDGHTAALYCRARHAYDALGDGDRYRAANQRQVISIVAKKVLASDPATMASTISTMASYVTTDMDVASIITLGTQFIGMNPEKDFYSGMEPTYSVIIDGIYYEKVDTQAWSKMMGRVRKGLPPTDATDISALDTTPDGTTGAGALTEELEEAETEAYALEDESYDEDVPPAKSSPVEQPTYDNDGYEDDYEGDYDVSDDGGDYEGDGDADGDTGDGEDYSYYDEDYE